MLLASGLTNLAPAADADTAAVGAKSDPASAGLEEIMVTAEKRSERLQDVPVPVTAITTETLLQSGQTRLEDYFAQIPGVDFTSNVRGAPVIAIRGLVTATDVINPTVGIVVDDVPFGSSTGLGGGDTTPDIDPSDLQRVEVLRGPQGTLYGASSLGGLVKFVTVAPSTDRLFGNIQAGVNGVHNGDEAGYNVRGSVNVPLSDTWALLASAFTHQDPGYIDNPSHGLRAVNESRSSGARLSTLWQPSDAFSVKLSALYQQTKSDGANHVEIQSGLGDLQQNDVPNTGILDKKFQAYSATVNAKLGPAELTSVTGYTINHVTDLVDYSVGLGFLNGYTQAALGIPDGTTGVTLNDDNQTNRFTQELRLSMPLGDRIEWLMGGFFTHERSPFVQTILASDPSTGANLGKWARFDWVVTYREFAGFSDLTFHLTDRFDVQIGAREGDIEQTYQEVDTGPFVPLFELHPTPLYIDRVVTHSSAFTYLVTPRYKITPDLMVYARLASGYRPGGPNPTASAFGLPLEFKPDKAQNYELGIKGDIADHVFSFDASLYYIDWKNIQLTSIDPNIGFAFNSNGSRAKSQGIELSTETRPFAGLAISAWVAYNDAVLTEPFPAGSSLYGGDGDRLPFGSRFSGSVAVNDDFPITGKVKGFAGASVSYVGNRVGNFTSAPPSPPPRQEYPGYAKVDLRGGVKIDPWTVSLYVNNATDRRGILYGGLGTVPNPAEFEYIQPRTVGMNVSRSF
jgi:iron complex outermembrane receptor protein